ncbi:uncharacterized protein TRUGW13939_00111 [Talaromyces rugulosus]|uniref:Malate dehydrogenase n=1 Tax=Talaromyces rugulosus TaxID=121627 RepID=A0A7H8QGF2_TALRU|nr:uncharacterized protein TRUGW13939_00111 [Talaromyces rugulosus]QKX53040.1 hypothetical protein TRUGW13939_00111 [Talaromyces rugulosus]
MFIQSLALFSLYLHAVVDAAPTTGGILSDTLALVSSSTELSQLKVTGCSLKDISPPLNETSVSLSGPETNGTLAYVALGRGTQNYTCADNSSSSVPTATGAVATMFDASCLAGDVDLLADLTMAIAKLPHDATVLAGLSLKQLTASSESLVLAEHFFSDSTTPKFDFRPFDHSQWVQTKKLESVDAPSTAMPGSVKWLKLGYKDGVGIHQVYRTLTAGGNAPATCEGQQPDIEVQYAAAYYFYS